MIVENANIRPKYTDNEIAKLFRDSKKEKQDSTEALAERYNVSIDIINYIEEGKVSFTMPMVNIVSDYVGIPISELTGLTTDDNVISLRGSINDETKALINMVNVLFDEMIMQKKLSI